MAEDQELVAYRPQTVLYFKNEEELNDFKRTIESLVKEDLGYQSLYQFLKEFLVALYMVKKSNGSMNGEALQKALVQWFGERTPKRRRVGFLGRLRRLM